MGSGCSLGCAGKHAKSTARSGTTTPGEAAASDEGKGTERTAPHVAASRAAKTSLEVGGVGAPWAPAGRTAFWPVTGKSGAG